MNPKIEIESWLLVRYHLPIPHKLDYDVLREELTKAFPTAVEIYINQHAVYVTQGESGVYIELKYEAKGFVAPNKTRNETALLGARFRAEKALDEQSE